MEAVQRLRYLTATAIAFSVLGALLMFVMGSVTMVQAAGTYAGTGDEKAWSSDAALDATVKVVTGLDQFLLALFLIIFASGVYALWWTTPSSGESDDPRPRWLTVRTVGDLKVQLLEVIAVILAVLFLKLLLEVTKAAELPWTLLVIPAGVLFLSTSIWLIRSSEH